MSGGAGGEPARRPRSGPSWHDPPALPGGVAEEGDDPTGLVAEPGQEGGRDVEALRGGGELELGADLLELARAQDARRALEAVRDALELLHVLRRQRRAELGHARGGLRNEDADELEQQRPVAADPAARRDEVYGLRGHHTSMRSSPTATGPPKGFAAAAASSARSEPGMRCVRTSVRARASRATSPT